MDIEQHAVEVRHTAGQDTRPSHTKSEIAQRGQTSAMIFSDFYKSPRSPLSKLRSHHPQVSSDLPTTTPDWVGDEYADLLSKDKAKQKEAVKRYLTEKVRADWSFTWPPQSSTEDATTLLDTKPVEASEQARRDEEASALVDEAVNGTREDDGYRGDEGTELDEPVSDGAGENMADDDDDDDADSIYSVVSEDAVHYRPRMEWTSDLSDDDDVPTASSAFRFDNPDSVKSTMQANSAAKKARRRRALRDEIAWNEGLSCFEARRNAWTGAKTVRVRTRPMMSPSTSPRSPRRFFFRRSMSTSPPIPGATTLAQNGDGGVSDSSSMAKDSVKDFKRHRTTDSSASESIDARLYPVETLLPVGQPLLPPNNPLRASISPTVYLSLYDKVIIHNLQPACPINLADMLRSCVAGWKRDGEWPPRPSAAETIAASRRKKKANNATSDNNGGIARRMSFGILGREKDDEPGSGKGIRRSLQRALGIGVVAGIHES